MDKRDQKLIARELRGLYKLADDLDRRVSSMFLNGKVADIDGNLVRLEIMPKDERTGKPFLSPWVQVQEAAGRTGTHFPVAKGDPMRLLSPNGELGPQSLAVRDGYTNAAGNPTDKKQQELIIAHAGEVRIKGSKIVLEADDVDVKSGTLTHNTVNVGDTHEHIEVMAGDDLTGPPDR